jgi:hypothetical protein
MQKLPCLEAGDPVLQYPCIAVPDISSYTITNFLMGDTKTHEMVVGANPPQDVAVEVAELRLTGSKLETAIPLVVGS